MSRRPLCMLALLTAILLVQTPIGAQNLRLDFGTRRPTLVDCLDRQCFRLDVIALDERDQPVDLPESAQFEVSVNGTRLPNVHAERRRATTPAGRVARVEPRIQFVLFDTSGSMNTELVPRETRFEAARRQLERLLDSFRDGVDQMAIASFDSRQVTARIQAAQLVSTRDAVRQQVANLQPSKSGNTALYSAVRDALTVLEPHVRKGTPITLIVFTDGKNDVNHPKDDPGLLAGDEGLRTAVAKAREVGATIFSIGFGPKDGLDESAMRALAYPGPTNYFQAQDEARLTQVFAGLNRRAASGFRLLTGPMPGCSATLLGQSLQFSVRTGALEATAPWEGNPVMMPPSEGVLSAAEATAVASWDGISECLPSVVTRVAVLIGYSALLALLWFGMPRLIWPDRYIPKPALQAAKAGARPPARGQAAAGPAPRGGRPEVTIPPRPASRVGSSAPPPPPRRDAPAPPARARDRDTAATPRPPEGLGPRQATDATVFIPGKKPGRDS